MDVQNWNPYKLAVCHTLLMACVIFMLPASTADCNFVVPAFATHCNSTLLGDIKVHLYPLFPLTSKYAAMTLPHHFFPSAIVGNLVQSIILSLWGQKGYLFWEGEKKVWKWISLLYQRQKKNSASSEIQAVIGYHNHHVWPFIVFVLIQYIVHITNIMNYSILR